MSVKLNFYLRVFFVFTVSLALLGCGDEKPKSAFPQQTVKKYAQATALTGLVFDDSGPIKSGTVKVSDEKGVIVAETTLENSDRYRVEVPGGTLLPIELIFIYPAGSGNKPLKTAVAYPNITKFDINPLSTAIAEKAKALGGYTHGNLLRAAESMGNVPDDNKMTAGFRGDPTKQYGGWH